MPTGRLTRPTVLPDGAESNDSTVPGRSNARGLLTVQGSRRTDTGRSSRERSTATARPKNVRGTVGARLENVFRCRTIAKLWKTAPHVSGRRVRCCGDGADTCRTPVELPPSGASGHRRRLRRSLRGCRAEDAASELDMDDTEPSTFCDEP